MSESVLAQVLRVRRRLEVLQFLSTAAWSVTAFLAVGCVVVLVDKAYPLGIDLRWWIAGPVLAGLAVAAGLVWYRRRGLVEAAAELDHVCQLKERVSTLLALPAEAADEPAAVALRADVEERTKAIHVAEQFPLRFPRHGWAPLVPLAGLVALALFVSPFEWAEQAEARTLTEAEKAKLRDEAQILEKKLAERRKEATEAGVPEELKELTAQIEDATRELARSEKLHAKEAVLKLNDFAKAVEEQRKQLESLDMMKRNLARMAHVGKGPAEKLAQAMKQGDFKEALQQLKEMQKQLESGKLSATEKQQLARQLDAMKKQLEQMANLKQREEQLRKSLPPELLQKELAKLAQDAKKMQKLQDLAKKLGECAQCLNGKSADGQSGENPGSQQMAESLSQAAELISELAKDAATQQMLENMLSDLADARQGMCDAMGQGLGEGMGQSNGFGDGLGEGQGKGDRPESPDDTRPRLTKAKTELNRGQAFMAGKVEGNNFRGQSLVEIRQAAQAAQRSADEAITRQRVPKEYKEHTRDYFQRLNGQVQ